MTAVATELWVPTETLGIKRDDMPQIRADLTAEFLDYLRQMGVPVSSVEVPVGCLKATQCEFNPEKIEDFLTGDIDRKKLLAPIISSNDFYILDGHHRWVALCNLDPDCFLQTHRAGVDIDTLLQLAYEFDGVFYKDAKESVEVRLAGLRTFRSLVDALVR